MDMSKTPEQIDQDRRRLLGAATMGIAVAGAASLLPLELAAAPAGDTIRPFRVNVPRTSNSSISADASPPRDGRTRRPSMIGRRVYSSQNSRSWCATGERATTGARWKRG
jgi:hypothetical protein